MSTLETILLIMLVLDAIALGALVLLQQGKGADIGAAFGSGSANAVFGGAGSASFLAKLTTWLALGFFALSLGLAFTAKERAANLEDIGIPVVTAPVAPPEATTKSGQPAASEPQPQQDTTSPDAAPETRLTAPSEPVDSDIPDV
ncbi:MAG: preprotein translocase subunit SecG [Proteobacteria bacterium]|jgi:preprotein translocase subunit SecG|nr:preprotein translocase subunit SecG [Pseudomonadota bacterium]